MLNPSIYLLKYLEGDLLKDLYLRLIKEFPGDVGCFVIYFLNRVKLQPGQVSFMKLCYTVLYCTLCVLYCTVPYDVPRT